MLPRYSAPILRLISIAVGVAVVAVVLEWPLPRVLPVAIAFLAVEGYRVAEARYAFNRGWVKLPVGVAVLGFATLGASGTGEWWAVTLLALLGGWVTGDSLVDLREGPRETMPIDSLQYLQDASRLYRAIRDQPRDRETLATALELDPDRTDRLLQTLERQHRIEVSDGVYYPRSGSNRVARLRSSLRRAGDRLARPLALLPGVDSPSS